MLCVSHHPVFYHHVVEITVGDSDGSGGSVTFSSSPPIHCFLALNWKDLLQLQASIFSFSLFNSIVFHLSLAFSFSGLFWIQTHCKSTARSLPLGRAHKIRLGTALCVAMFSVALSLCWPQWRHRRPRCAPKRQTCHGAWIWNHQAKSNVSIGPRMAVAFSIVPSLGAQLVHEIVHGSQAYWTVLLADYTKVYSLVLKLFSPWFYERTPPPPHFMSWFDDPLLLMEIISNDLFFLDCSTEMLKYLLNKNVEISCPLFLLTSIYRLWF